MATTHTVYGRFIQHYRQLKRANRLIDTPIILTEGDSWFSTPLYYNLIDWIEIGAPEALFLRLEDSGDLALDIYAGASRAKLVERVRAFEFDIVLLSGGGNDFVDEFLADLFRGAAPMSLTAALGRVDATGRFDAVLRVYQETIAELIALRPGLRILGHGYDRPRLIGQAAHPSVEQLGLIALFKRSIGDWIGRHLRHVLPAPADQLKFAHALIDRFTERVLMSLKAQFPQNYDFVDLRGQLLHDADWNDEMHPSSFAFRRLAERVRPRLRAMLPARKRSGIG